MQARILETAVITLLPHLLYYKVNMSAGDVSGNHTLKATTTSMAQLSKDRFYIFIDRVAERSREIMHMVASVGLPVRLSLCVHSPV